MNEDWMRKWIYEEKVNGLKNRSRPLKTAFEVVYKHVRNKNGFKNRKVLTDAEDGIGVN